MQIPEFAVGHPRQIAKAAVAGADQRFHHHRREPDVVRGQVVPIIESDVHPRAPVRATRKSKFGILFFLAGEKLDLVRLTDGRPTLGCGPS
jgi:hypothetical protein